MEHFLTALIIVTFIAVNVALMIWMLDSEKVVWRVLSGILIFSIWVAGISLVSYSSESKEDNKTCVKYEERLVPVGKTLVPMDHCTAWLVEE